jgi:hypothetical protein
MLTFAPFAPFAPKHAARTPHASPIDYLHRPLLQTPRGKSSSYSGHVLQVEHLLQTSPSVLVGIINGNEARRKLLGCTWLRIQAVGRPSMRVLWVRGNASLTTQWHQPDAETLMVRCGERMYMHAARQGKKPSTFTGTFTMYYKVRAERVVRRVALPWCPLANAVAERSIWLSVDSSPLELNVMRSFITFSSSYTRWSSFSCSRRPSLNRLQSEWTMMLSFRLKRCWRMRAC